MRLDGGHMDTRYPHNANPIHTPPGHPIMKEESLEIVIGSVISCEPVAGTKRLHLLVVDIGDRTVQIASALPHFCAPGALLGRQVPVKLDVEPVVMHGITSVARLIAIRDGQGMPVLLLPQTPVANGDEVV